MSICTTLERRTVDLATLQTFCHDNSHSLGTPWSKDGFTYASCGFILVRVPALEVDPGGKGVATDQLYQLAGEMPETGWVDLPDLPDPVVCPKCNGGTKPDTCEECDGTGELSLSNRFSVYDGIECQSCGGSGKGNECPECCNERTVDAVEQIRIGDALFKVGQIRRLVTLTNPQIAPVYGKPSWIRFQGGDALVMGTVEASRQKQAHAG